MKIIIINSLILSDANNNKWCKKPFKKYDIKALANHPTNVVYGEEKL